METILTSAIIGYVIQITKAVWLPALKLFFVLVVAVAIYNNMFGMHGIRNSVAPVNVGVGEVTMTHKRIFDENVDWTVINQSRYVIEQIEITCDSPNIYKGGAYSQMGSVTLRMSLAPGETKTESGYLYGISSEHTCRLSGFQPYDTSVSESDSRGATLGE